MHRHDTVAAVNILQGIGKGGVRMVSDAAPDEGITRNDVHGDGIASVVRDTHNGVVTATVSVVTVEDIVDHGVVGKIGRRREEERGIGSGRHPKAFHLNLHRIRKFHRLEILYQRQFPLEDIAVVALHPVNHFNIPKTVQRTSDQTVKRVVRMIEIRARSHKRGIERFITLDGIMGVHIPINQTAGPSRVGVLVVVRPTVVPSHTRHVFGLGGITRVVGRTVSMVRQPKTGARRSVGSSRLPPA